MNATISSPSRATSTASAHAPDDHALRPRLVDAERALARQRVIEDERAAIERATAPFGQALPTRRAADRPAQRARGVSMRSGGASARRAAMPVSDAIHETCVPTWKAPSSCSPRRDAIACRRARRQMHEAALARLGDGGARARRAGLAARAPDRRPRAAARSAPSRARSARTRTRAPSRRAAASGAPSASRATSTASAPGRDQRSRWIAAAAPRAPRPARSSRRRDRARRRAARRAPRRVAPLPRHAPGTASSGHAITALRRAVAVLRRLC